jgi:hypothetical protein
MVARRRDTNMLYNRKGEVRVRAVHDITARVSVELYITEAENETR